MKRESGDVKQKEVEKREYKCQESVKHKPDPISLKNETLNAKPRPNKGPSKQKHHIDAVNVRILSHTPHPNNTATRNC